MYAAMSKIQSQKLSNEQRFKIINKYSSVNFSPDDDTKIEYCYMYKS